jgi:hypothetical protein
MNKRGMIHGGMGDRGQADKERNIGTETAEDVTRLLM